MSLVIFLLFGIVENLSEFLVAIGTLALASATVWIIFQNKETIKEMQKQTMILNEKLEIIQKERNRSIIKETIKYILKPLQEEIENELIIIDPNKNQFIPYEKTTIFLNNSNLENKYFYISDSDDHSDKNFLLKILLSESQTLTDSLRKRKPIFLEIFQNMTKLREKFYSNDAQELIKKRIINNFEIIEFQLPIDNRIFSSVKLNDSNNPEIYDIDTMTNMISYILLWDILNKPYLALNSKICLEKITESIIQITTESRKDILNSITNAEIEQITKEIRDNLKELKNIDTEIIDEINKIKDTFRIDYKISDIEFD